MNPLLGGMCSDTQLHNTATLGIHDFNPIKSGLKMLTGKRIWYLKSRYEGQETIYCWKPKTLSAY